tara:strand:- start:2218 stop:2445 length:228 start_codon:yes stop_codon:yes gene_type:complete
MERAVEAVVCHFHNWSPDFREPLMSCFSHPTFLQHTITDIAEDLKLLLTGESVSTITTFHNLEHLCFVGDHGCLP